MLRTGARGAWGGIETPGALEVARIPGVSVPVCVVTSVIPVCVVKGVSENPCVEVTPCMSETPRVEEAVCARETARVCEPPCVKETPSVEETPCVSGVVTSVPECVLPSTPCVKGAPQPETARVCEARCVSETPRVSAPAGVSSVVCVSEARRVSERPCVGRTTACVRSLYVREMTVAMHEHAAASPRVNGRILECSTSLVTRGSVSARVEWRRRLRLWRDKSRVAAVVAISTVPGLHGSVRVVRAMQRTRPPRAQLRG